jgi:hypothetical protein
MTTTTTGAQDARSPHARRFHAAAQRNALPPESLFLRAADWVSEVMGEPPNIIFWFVLCLGWTLIFAFGIVSPNANFLPAWFTGTAFNFPLNLITTVAELFIGFLVAAAANRAQRVLSTIIDGISTSIDTTEKLVEENTALTKQVHDLAQQIHDHLTATTGSPSA